MIPRHPRRSDRRQSGVSMVEFALVAPLFLILVFLVLDFGKAIYVKNTLDSAAREGARVGVVLESTYASTCPGSGEPTACDVETAAQKHSSDVALANPSPYCYKHTADAAPTKANSGNIYIDVNPQGVIGGDSAPPPITCPDGTVLNLSPVSAQKPVTVTIVYCYKPLFPLLTTVLALATSGNCKGGITMISTSTMNTEY